MKETRAALIRQRLTDAFAPVILDIADESSRHAGHAGAHAAGESHFRVKIVSAAFTGMASVARHRAIYATLGEEIAPDRIHALALDAKTPDEAGLPS